MQEKEKLITQDELKCVLIYDAALGRFSRYPKKGNKKVIGYLHPTGYRCIKVAGRTYREHRLVWLYVHGRFPIEHLDHIDGDKSNNKLDNLRECSHIDNMKNQTKRYTNKSGFLGVNWKEKLGKWVAQVQSEGKKIHLGYFLTPEEASEAYQKFCREHHRGFCREITK